MSFQVEHQVDYGFTPESSLRSNLFQKLRGRLEPIWDKLMSPKVLSLLASVTLAAVSPVMGGSIVSASQEQPGEPDLCNHQLVECTLDENFLTMRFDDEAASTLANPPDSVRIYRDSFCTSLLQLHQIWGDLAQQGGYDYSASPYCLLPEMEDVEIDGVEHLATEVGELKFRLSRQPLYHERSLTNLFPKPVAEFDAVEIYHGIKVPVEVFILAANNQDAYLPPGSAQELVQTVPMILTPETVTTADEVESAVVNTPTEAAETPTSSDEQNVELPGELVAGVGVSIAIALLFAFNSLRYRGSKEGDGPLPSTQLARENNPQVPRAQPSRRKAEKNWPSPEEQEKALQTWLRNDGREPEPPKLGSPLLFAGLDEEAAIAKFNQITEGSGSTPEEIAQAIDHFYKYRSNPDATHDAPEIRYDPEHSRQQWEKNALEWKKKIDKEREDRENRGF